MYDLNIKILSLLISIFFIILKIKAKIQIYVYVDFDSYGDQFLLCNYENRNITIYYERGELVTITVGGIETQRTVFKLAKLNNSLSERSDDICNKIIYYNRTIDETIIIGFNEVPNNFHGLFRRSDISSISIVFNEYHESSTFNFSNMFQDCKSLTSIRLINFNFGNNPFDFSNMFSGCTNLKYLLFTKINESYWSFCNNNYSIDFSGMFQNCFSLTSINLSDFTTCSVKLDNIFSGCKNLYEILFSKNM